MEHSLVQFNDLPDEILMIILKKLWNIQVLYSLIGVNKRLNAIVHDPIFSNRLTLMKDFSAYSIDRLPDSILERFCSEILPEIHHNIKWINLESSSMKRILLATNYPNLYGLGLYDIEIETFLSLVNDGSSSTSIDKSQILALVIGCSTYGKIISTNNMNATILAHIFTTLSNLQCLSFCPSSTWNNLLSFVNSSPGINSSTLLELDVHLVCFSDCLYILDGGFSNLHTLHIDIKCIKSSDLTDRNQ
ncbi:unnamed protein product, partial [Rotaria magnacalcarata]